MPPVNPPVTDMTMRDYFAGQIITGFVSAHLKNKAIDFELLKVLAQVAYKIADAMIEVR